MTYEEEQIKYAEELKQVTNTIKKLDELFEDPNQIDSKIYTYYIGSNPLSKYQFLSQFELQQKIDRTRQFLEEIYHQNKIRKKELEFLLSQSPTERQKYNIKNNIGKTFEYIASITPNHVSGRVYEVKNGDGCAMFCFWFTIIGAIICFIIYICTEI